MGLWTGELTPRRASVLARHLPPGAQVYTEAGSDAAWTAGEHLTALVVDALQVQTWQAGGGKGRAPKPIPRPEQIAAEQAKAERVAAKALRFQEKQRARKGGDDG